MIKAILRFSIRQRWLIMLFVLGIVILGLYNFNRLPIDAVPDITNVQVQINTEAPGYTPLEVEQRITYPIEMSMSGLPKLEYTRSLSRYGLSQITVVFKEGTDIYFARQLVAQRLQSIADNLPEGIEAEMGPISTGLGEIYMYKLTTDKPETFDARTLRTIQDWLIRPQLRNISGVAEVNAIGGFTRQYQVSPRLKRLVQRQLTLQDLESALKKNNDNVGAGYIEKKGQQYLLRVPGQLKTIHDIEQVVIKAIEGVPIRIRDVADVTVSHELRQGAGLANGQETVIGTVSMLTGENSRVVAQRVHQALKAINKTLPQGVFIETVYNRTDLVNATIKTVKNNLLEGALLVVVVLFLFLGNIRAAIITALVIPLSMLITISGMYEQKISANLMSLGALDFGLIVDGAVIIVENCVKNFVFRQRQLGRALSLPERLETTFESTREVIRPSMYGVIIITVVYLPILTLSGVEGKMFKPMAQTVTLALISSIILSFTFIPAAIALWLSPSIIQRQNRMLLWCKKIYKPVLTNCFRYRNLIQIASVILVTGTVLLAFYMGGEFIPSLDEGDIAMHALRIPSTSLSQSVKMQKQLERRILTFPEVKTVFSKIGTADIATDPMPPNVADTFIILKPKSQWPDKGKSKTQLIQELQQALMQEPGNNYEFTQPIQMRFNELISGVRADVAIKIFGDNRELLLQVAEKILQLIHNVKGAEDARVEQVGGLPTITIEINRKLLAQYGLHMSDVQQAIKTALSGTATGLVYEGDKYFAVIIRLNEASRKDPNILSKIYIELPEKEDKIAHFLPLSEVATLKEGIGPNQISRENAQRRIVVTTNVRDRDLSSFIKEVKTIIQAQIDLPSGYWIDYGGQFEQLESATQRLLIVIPVTLLIILILLYMAVQSIPDALLVFSGIPLALTGGVLALWIRDIPLSISAAVGFIALSGVAVLNGLVMISFINRLRQNNTLVYAIIRGAMVRLRPILMTALVASLGFIPMALSTGTGAEVQRPLATVVIGGLISSTFLTLIVLPGLYFRVHKKRYYEFNH